MPTKYTAYVDKQPDLPGGPYWATLEKTVNDEIRWRAGCGGKTPQAALNGLVYVNNGIDNDTIEIIYSDEVLEDMKDG